MALIANYPIAVAPGMGLNGYFTYSVALAHKGMDYHVALDAVFVSALISSCNAQSPSLRVAGWCYL